MNPYVLVLYFGLVAIFSANNIFGFIITDDNKCKYMKTDKGLKVRCYRMDLKEVPQYLTVGIDVLDLSYNRLRKLKKTSFQRYSNIEYLLLYDNMIQSIEPDTFTSLTSLQEIDMSNNALTTIPLEIFQLPSLRNLYVDSNDLINLKEDIKNLKTPIYAPLEYLNVADCSLNEIPNLGILPRLWHLNASKNPLEHISVQQFAPLCRIKSLDLTENNMPYCACQTLKKYLKYLGIKTDYIIDCDNVNVETMDSLCPDLTNITVHSTEFQECNSVVIFNVTSMSFWLFIAGGIAGLIFVVLFLIICIRSKKRKRIKRKNNLKPTHNTEEYLLSAKESS